MKNLTDDDVPKCPTCGEPFFPGQKYYAAPYKQHVICRKFQDESMEVGRLLYERYMLRGGK